MSSLTVSAPLRQTASYRFTPEERRARVQQSWERYQAIGKRLLVAATIFTLLSVTVPFLFTGKPIDCIDATISTATILGVTTLILAIWGTIYVRRTIDDHQRTLNFLLCHSSTMTADKMRHYLAIGADPHCEGGYAIPLESAALRYHPDCIDVLLEAGVDVNAKAGDGWTPLHGAAYRGSLVCVQKLITAGANVNATLPRGHTPLQLVRNAPDADQIRALLQPKANA